MVCRALLGKIAAVAPTHLSLRSLLRVSRDQALLIDLDSNYEQIRTGCYQRTRIYPRLAGKPGIDPLAGAAPGGVNIGNDPGQRRPRSISSSAVLRGLAYIRTSRPFLRR